MLLVNKADPILYLKMLEILQDLATTTKANSLDQEHQLSKWEASHKTTIVMISQDPASTKIVTHWQNADHKQLSLAKLTEPV